MVTLSKYTSFLIMIMVISGCSNLTVTEKDELLFNQINELEMFIDEKKWDQALSDINEFHERYHNRKWKMQLLAGLEDYKEFELEIEKLKETIKDKDELESKIGLKQLKHRMFIIYNL